MGGKESTTFILFELQYGKPAVNIDSTTNQLFWFLPSYSIYPMQNKHGGRFYSNMAMALPHSVENCGSSAVVLLLPRVII